MSWPTGREDGAADDVHGHAAGEGGEVQFDGLGGAGQVADTEDGLAVMLPQVGQDLSVAGIQEPLRAPAERAVPGPDGEHAPGPVEQGVGVARLRFHVDGGEAVDRVHDGRQHQAGGVGAGEAAVAVDGPLHGRADAVAVAEEDVVAHPDLVAVVDDGGAGHGQQQAVHQLDPAAVALQQRGEAAADAEVDACPTVGGVGVP